MENSSIKEKIFYWGGLTLISSVIIGGSYYIYKSIFSTDEENENENKIMENDNNILGNSFLLNNSKNNQNINNNIDNSINNNINNIINNKIEDNNTDNNINNKIEGNNTDNNISNNINSTIFPKNINNIFESQNNNIINTSSKEGKINDEIKEEDENIIKIQKEINIFKDDKIFLKSLDLNIDESKLYNNSNNLTEEGAVHLIMYINYLSQKLYLIDNPTLDQKRRALLTSNLNNNEMNNKEKNEEYLLLCNQTFDFRQKAYKIASEKIFKSLQYPMDFQQFDDFMKNILPKQLEKITIKLMAELNDTLFKYDMNFMDINTAKEAYIFYLKLYIDNAKKLNEEQENMKNANEDEEKELNEANNILIYQFMILKMQIDDILYEKYHIAEEHLKLLINKYNLFDDSEISQLQKEFEEFNENIDQNK